MAVVGSRLPRLVTCSSVLPTADVLFIAPRAVPSYDQLFFKVLGSKDTA